MTTLEVVVDAELAPATNKRAKQMDALVQAAKAAVAQALDKWAMRVAEAYQEQIHLGLGYASWDDYAYERCRIDFGNPQERQRAVGMLAGEGLSTRAIGSVTGTSEKTVRNDQQSQVRNDSAPEGPPTTIGRDGKTYPKKKKEKPEPPPPKMERNTINRDVKNYVRDIDSLTRQMTNIVKLVGLLRTTNERFSVEHDGQVADAALRLIEAATPLTETRS